jgi:hypothetical protein
MKKIMLVALVAAGLTALTGTAQAKEVMRLKICGASGCNTVTDREALRGWEEESNQDPASVSIAAPGRFYTVEIAFGDPEGNVVHSDTAYWLPNGNLMRFTNQTLEPWWQLFPNQVALYEKVASGIEAFTPELSNVTVRGRAVADPNSYLRLFGKYRYATLPRAGLHLVRIRMTASQPNPWVNGRVVLRYDAKRRLLVRPDGYFKLPKTVGRLLMKRASLGGTTSSSGSGGGGHTALYAGVGAAGLVALGVLAVARRKKMT